MNSLRIHLFDPVEHAFKLLGSAARPLQPGRNTVENVSPPKHLTDPSDLGERLFGRREFLSEQSSSDDLLRFVVIALVQFDSALARSVSPRFARLTQLGEDALVTHPNPESYLRCPRAEAVVLVCRLVIFPELLDVQVYQGVITPPRVLQPGCYCAQPKNTTTALSNPADMLT